MERSTKYSTTGVKFVLHLILREISILRQVVADEYCE